MLAPCNFEPQPFPLVTSAETRREVVSLAQPVRAGYIASCSMQNSPDQLVNIGTIATNTGILPALSRDGKLHFQAYSNTVNKWL